MAFTPIKAKGTVQIDNDYTEERYIKFDETKKFYSQLKFIAVDTEVIIEVREYNEAKEKESFRSAAQNRYYHKMLDVLCDYTGDTHMDMHEQLKVRFLAKPYVLEDKEYMIVKSTTELTTKNFAEYLDKIFHWAAEELEVTLPAASEYY